LTTAEAPSDGLADIIFTLVREPSSPQCNKIVT
jgi:hypothetical protein